jgi:hypothetical protein
MAPAQGHFGRIGGGGDGSRTGPCGEDRRRRGRIPHRAGRVRGSGDGSRTGPRREDRRRRGRLPHRVTPGGSAEARTAPAPGHAGRTGGEGDGSRTGPRRGRTGGGDGSCAGGGTAEARMARSPAGGSCGRRPRLFRGAAQGIVTGQAGIVPSRRTVAVATEGRHCPRSPPRYRPVPDGSRLPAA